MKVGKLGLQECADNQQKERVKVGKLELQECADNQQTERVKLENKDTKSPWR